MVAKRLKTKFIAAYFVVLLVIGLGTESVYAQKAHTIGLSIEGYSSGVITSLRGGFEINQQQEVSILAGYNFLWSSNSVVHEEEEGSGPGLGVEYRFYTKDELDGFFFGAKTSVWFMDIEWRDEAPARNGTTEVTVLQPAAEIGYNLIGGRSSLMVAPVAGFGWQFNIRSSGETVADGVIFSGGINISYLF